MGLSLSWSFNRWVSWEQHCYMYILRIHSLMYHVKHDICKVFFLKVSHTLCFGHILALSYSSNDVFQCLWTLRGDSAGRKEEILTSSESSVIPWQLASRWRASCLPPARRSHSPCTHYHFPHSNPSCRQVFTASAKCCMLGLLRFSTNS